VDHSGWAGVRFRLNEPEDLGPNEAYRAPSH
jgi:hypothetical protein